MTRTSTMPLILLFLAVVGSVSGREFFRCGYKRCDRELQYCDMELNDCVQCIDVCRRDQHRSMDQLCEKECPLYLKRRRAEEAIAIRPLSTTEKPDIVMTTEPPTALPESSEQKAPIGIIGICTLVGLGVLILIVIAVPLFLMYRKQLNGNQPRRIQPAESAAMTEQPSTPAEAAAAAAAAAEPATVRQENEESGERTMLLNRDEQMPKTPLAEGSSYATTAKGRQIAQPENNYNIDSGLTTYNEATTTTPSNSPAEPAPNQATGPDVADDTDIAQPNDGTDEEIQAPGETLDSATQNPDPDQTVDSFSPSLNLTEPGPASDTSHSEGAVPVLSPEFVQVHARFEGPGSGYYPSQHPSFEPDDSFRGLVSNPGTTPTPQESALPSVHRGRRRRLSSGNG